MTRRTFQFGGSLLVAMVLACGSGLRPVNPPSFIRPNRVAFSCVRTDKAGDPVPVPIEQCSPCKGHTGEHSLYAFVTQSARGEMAAVNLKARQVIDTQTTVPGYTFVPVGEAPSAIAVPTVDPTHTYVVSVGSSDLRVLDTQRLLGTRGISTATLAVIPLGSMTSAATWQDAEPVDMVLSTDEQRLVIAAPRLHAVIVIEVSDLDRVLANEITAAEVPQTIVALSGLSAPTTLVTATGSDRYSETCGVPRAQPSQSVAPRTVDATSADAMPVALTLDADNNRVLVADAALPIIHAVDLTTLTEITDSERPLFVTGVPTLDVVISPPVPVSHGDSVFERYIYAIDADQRGVLVLNDRGVMQSVNAMGTPDRIDFGPSGAMSLEIIEPGYRDCAPNTNLIGPPILRGVFLAAAMVDGDIRITDIYDAHAEVRCTPLPTTGESVECSPSDPCAAIHRHRPRLATAFTSKRPCVAPSLDDITSRPVSLPVTNGTRVPSLDALTDCSSGQAPALQRVTVDDPDSAADDDDGPTLDCPAEAGEHETRETLVCVNTDPWTMSGDSWFATWEGFIPGASGAGTLHAGAPNTFETRSIDFCAAGVEGGARYEIELVVTPAVPELIKLYDVSTGVDLSRVDCSLFTKKYADGTHARLAVEITAATPNTLTLGEFVDVPEGFTESDVIDGARHCVAGMLFSFAVRSHDRYTVQRGSSGFTHRVSNVSGACEAPPETDVLGDGQAAAGKRFENASIAFQISAPADDEPTQELSGEPTQGLSYEFALSPPPTPLRCNAGVLSTTEVAWTIVSELRYSPIDMQLYAVDSSLRGLIPIPLSPLLSSVSSSRIFR